jgi:CzcA family heavy metal efflux pump
MNALIRFSLQNRLLIVSLSLAVLIVGGLTTISLPIDIFPNLTRPRVVVMTECLGLAPEEVETLVTIPLETALNGASGVQTVRSSSGVGLSVIYVEFDWNSDVYRARQIVNERIASIGDRLPRGVKPELAPNSSLMGQIMMIGLYSEEGTTSPMEVRTIADWTIRPRLLGIPGVSQVITMGGGRKQYQVLVDPNQLQSFKLTLADVERALSQANQNVAGGYLERGSHEYLVRAIGRVQSVEDLAQSVVKSSSERSVLLGDVARIEERPQLKRGDSSVNGHPAVVLTIGKQPSADTLKLTDEIRQALDELKATLPPDVVIDSTIFQLRKFIDLGIHNVIDALRDGAILVLIVLFLFLLNVRTTFITLTAIPLSIVITGVVFYLFGVTINVMTLGGIAVAMGELVDDAIVDIENVFRRLNENSREPNPKPVLEVVYQASLEIRGSIVFGTLLVILVFVPLFALSGIEGRLFAPLGVAYIVSILASLLVSLTVTPVLGSLLLSPPPGRTDPVPQSSLVEKRHGKACGDSPLLRLLKRLVTPIIQISMHPACLAVILALVSATIVGSMLLVRNLGADFLPPFDEGAAQINFVLPPGSSLDASNRISRMVDAALKHHMYDAKENPRGLVTSFVRRSGRAELDEHAESVNVTEYIVSLNPRSGQSRQHALATLRTELDEIPGLEYEVEQPLAHLISHMLSGVTAQIAIKVFGEDLNVLRQKADEIKLAIQRIPGLAPPIVEPQQLIPQLRIELLRDQLSQYGLTPGDVNDFIETAMNGRVVSSILEGQRTFDLVVRLDDQYRSDFDVVRRMSIALPNGGRVPLSAVARIYEAGGPNTIHHERTRKRVAVRANTTGRDLASVVAEIRNEVQRNVVLPAGYYVEYGGQFEAQQEATQRIALLSLVSLGGVFLVLYTLFPSTRIVLQIMLALPIAFVGGVLALWLTGQTNSVASLVGFISLGGIAARNGILLVSHYLHLMKEEGEDFTETMIVRGSLERLAPVLMTALTAGIGLVPLVLGGQQPGKEILYPVATVILGGLCTSTICEYVVHPGLFWRYSGKAARRLTRIAKSNP